MRCRFRLVSTNGFLQADNFAGFFFVLKLGTGIGVAVFADGLRQRVWGWFGARDLLGHRRSLWLLFVIRFGRVAGKSVECKQHGQNHCKFHDVLVDRRRSVHAAMNRIVNPFCLSVTCAMSQFEQTRQ